MMAAIVGHSGGPPERAVRDNGRLNIPDCRDCNRNLHRDVNVRYSNLHCGACDQPCDGGTCQNGVCAIDNVVYDAATNETRSTWCY